MNSLINIIINAETSGAVSGMNRAGTAAGLMGNQMTAAERAMASTASTARTLQTSVLAMASGLGVSQLVQMSDQYTKYVAQLKLATGSTAEFNAANAEVRRISSEAQSDLSATGVLYARIANGTRELGIGQKAVANITETVNLSLKVSGATAAESSSAMLQLSQSFASGTLRGEEFNAVNEAAPRLMKALADGIGVPVGQLKEMASNGQLTSKVMAGALPKALADLREEAKSVQTISGAFTALKNNVMEFVGVQSQASGVVSALTGGIGALTDNLGLLVGVAGTFAGVRLAVALEAIIVTTYGNVVANRALVASNLTAAESQAAAATVASFLATVRVNELRASVLAAEGATALAITTNGLIPAQARAAAAAEAHTVALAALSVAQRAASVTATATSSVLGLLGGPIGLITAALGLGATAWMLWEKSSEDASNKAAQAMEASSGEIIANLDKQNAKLAERLMLVRAGNADAAKSGGPEIEKMAATLNQINALKAKGAAITGVEQITLIEQQGIYDQIQKSLQTKTSLQGELDKTSAGAAAQKILQKQSGVPESYLTDLKTLKDALDTGAISHDVYVKAVSKLATETWKASEAGKAAAKTTAAGTKAAKAATTQYNDLMLRVAERIALADDELKAGRQLTEAQKQEVKLTELLDSAKGKVNASQRTEIEGALAEVRAKEMLLEQQHAQTRSRKDLADADAKRVQDMESSLSAMSEQNKTLTEEIELLGLNEQAQFAITQARLSSAIALKEEQLARMQNTEFMSREQIALEEEIRLMKEKLGLQGQKFAKNTAVEEAKKAEEEWKKFYEDIEHGLTDSLYRAFESGNGFFETFWSGIKNLFKTTVLKLAVQAVVGGVTGAASSFINSGLGNTGGLSSLINIGSSIGSGITQTIANALPSAVSTSLGMTSSALMASNAALAGGGASGMAAASAAAAAGNATALGGFGSAMAAIPGWGWAALGVAAVGAAALGGKKDSRYGAAYDYTQADGTKVVGGPNAGVDFAGKSTAADLTVQGINAMLERLGSAEKISRFSSGFESSEKGKGFSFAGGELTNGMIFGQGVGGLGWQNNRGSKTAEQAMAEYQTELQQATLQALQSATDVPKLISSKLSGINVDALSGDALSQLMATVDAQITAVEQFRGSMLQLPFSNMRDLSFGAAAGLIEMSGGIDALNNKLAAYYKDFYTDAERRAQTVATINAATAGAGLDAATATRASFRALVESQDLTTEAGQKTYAALIGVAGAFAEITPAADAASNALKDAADAASNALKDAAAAAEKATAATRAAAKSEIDVAAAGFEKSKSNTSEALAALERSVAAEKSRITVVRDVAAESVRSITGVFSLLQEQVKQLYGTVGSTSAMQVSQGNAYIDQALSTALSSGYLPDSKELADAISAARGGLNTNQFASQFEADRAALVMAGKLSQIQSISGTQLSTAELALQAAEDQLSALDAALEYQKAQVNLLNGINGSVLSIGDAISALAGAMEAQKSAAAEVSKAWAAGAASLYASNSDAVQAPGKTGLDYWQSEIAANGYDSTATKFDASVSSINSTVKSWYAGNEDATKTPAQADVAYWLGEIDYMGEVAAKEKFAKTVAAMTGNPPQPLNSFEVGINRVPFDMVAQIHEGEAIVPAVFNPFNPSADNRSSELLAAQIRDLTLEVKNLKSLLGIANTHAKRTADAINGNPDQPIPVAILEDETQ